MIFGTQLARWSYLVLGVFLHRFTTWCFWQTGVQPNTTLHLTRKNSSLIYRTDIHCFWWLKHVRTCQQPYIIKDSTPFFLVPVPASWMHCPTEPAIDASSDHAVPWTLALLPGKGTKKTWSLVNPPFPARVYTGNSIDVHPYGHVNVNIKYQYPSPSVYLPIYLSICLSNMRTNIITTCRYIHIHISAGSARLGIHNWKLMGDRMALKTGHSVTLSMRIW